MKPTKKSLQLVRLATLVAAGLLPMLIAVPAMAQAETEAAFAGDQLTLTRDGKQHELVGDVLLDAQDNSMYFMQDDGRAWFVKPDEIKRRIDSEQDAEPASFEAMEKSLLEELPEDFRIYKTKHYLIAYQTERAYAKWMAQLYEGRLYRQFEIFWRNKKLPLTKPKYPMVVIIFKTKAEYQRYVDRDLGPGQDIVAYYNLLTNRVAMFDFTAGDRRPGEEISARRIEEITQNPAAIYMVATIVHEGTHQLMYNRGVQTRFADSPLWLNEGLAMFFEAPDLRNKKGWKAPGRVFDQRLIRFRNTLQNRPQNSIERLLTDDDRLKDPETAADGYAEAWAFNHFLLKRHSKEYIEYLKEHAMLPPLSTADSKQRLDEFQKHFDDDFERLEKNFLKYISRLR